MEDQVQEVQATHAAQEVFQVSEYDLYYWFLTNPESLSISLPQSPFQMSPAECAQGVPRQLHRVCPEVALLCQVQQVGG